MPKQILLRVDPLTHDLLETMAKSEDRSLNNFCRRYLEKLAREKLQELGVRKGVVNSVKSVEQIENDDAKTLT